MKLAEFLCLNGQGVTNHLWELEDIVKIIGIMYQLHKDNARLTPPNYNGAGIMDVYLEKKKGA